MKLLPPAIGAAYPSYHERQMVKFKDSYPQYFINPRKATSNTMLRYMFGLDPFSLKGNSSGSIIIADMTTDPMTIISETKIFDTRDGK